MGRTLRYIGLVVLAGAAWVVLAGELGWIEDQQVDLWFGPLLRAGGMCFVGGIVLAILSPMLRRLRQGRCVRCGASTERGQTYCNDHLQAAVHEFQDRARQRNQIY